MATMLGQGRVTPNEEKWRHDYHQDGDAELIVIVAGIAGAQNLGDPVAAGMTRRIRELSIRNTCIENVVVYLRAQITGNIKLSVDVSAQSTRVWSSQDGRIFTAEEQPQIYASAVTGGTIYVTGAALEE